MNITKFILIALFLCSCQNQKTYTMGIICLELDSSMKNTLYKIYGQQQTSLDYIQYFQSACRVPTTYIKMLALKNIKFMPIFYTNNKNDLFLEQIEYLDGIMMIGGTVSEKFQKDPRKFDDNEYQSYTVQPEYPIYGELVQKVLKKAKQINDNGRVFLVIAQCQSMMDVLMYESNHKARMFYIQNNGQLLPIELDFSENFNEGSRIKAFFTSKEREILRSGNNTYFFHNYAFELNDFMSIKELRDNYYPVAIFHKDPNKTPKDFIAAAENKHYPIFVFQYHPEKILFETVVGITQTIDNMNISTRYAEFIYSELEKGAEGNDIPEEIIMKYSCPTYSMANILIFTEVYLYDCGNVILNLQNQSQKHVTEIN